MRYPRILIISDSPFCLTTGFGVTLTTLFQDWPKNRLFQLYRMDEIKPDKSVCERTVWADIPGHSGRRYALPYLLGLKPAWRSKYSLCWLKKTLRNWKPDLIYSLSYSIPNITYAAWASKKLNCPHIAHIADDGIRNEDMHEEIKNILKEAKMCVAISEEMKQEYQRRYEIECSVLHNGAADTLFLPPKSHKFSDKTIVIRYIGSIIREHHLESIEDIIEAVKAFNQAGNSARLEIYGGEWTRDTILPLVNNKDVTYRGFVSTEEGYELLKTADLLVIPITFSKPQFECVRLSMPTKFSEYLASGSPALVYGPSGVAPVEYCRNNGLGIIQTKRSVEDLVGLLSDTKNNRAAFSEKASNDRIFARENLSAAVMRKKLYKSFEKALNSTGVNQK